MRLFADVFFLTIKSILHKSNIVNNVIPAVSHVHYPPVEFVSAFQSPDVVQSFKVKHVTL